MGKLGRRAVAEVMAGYKKKYKPDLVMANAENLAHGIGMTMDTVMEMFEAGVDLLTGGNHSFKKKGYEEIFTNFENKVLRPANYPAGVAGRGYTTLKVKGKRVVAINLCGRVFLDEDLDDPFKGFDQILELLKIAKNDIVVVDFHAEATSEKRAFGSYTDGQASAVVGSHTHVPTADNKILPMGTAYVTDIGMVGATDSVLGVDKTGPLTRFLTQLPAKFEMVEQGAVEVSAVLIEVDGKSGRAKSIKRVDSQIEI